MRMMKSIIVVVASPSDLEMEREMIKQLIDSYNIKGKKWSVFFDIRRWEDVPPGLDKGGAQGIIDKELEIADADIFICMFAEKAGTILEGENITGTEHELYLALDSYERRGKPDVKLFFKRLEREDNDDTSRIKSVEEKVE